MATKNKKLSTLIESQIPNFITSDYPKFVEFIQKYYEQLESVGQPLDLIFNLDRYRDIDTYDNSILQETASLISINETRNGSNIITEVTVTLDDATPFPKNNGYILIDDEIIFYENKVGNVLHNCYRNISGTTKLGDLYSSSTVINVDYADLGKGSAGQEQSGTVHYSGAEVRNLSNLFLFAFVKSFQNQYLDGFPEQSLKSSVNKKTLIKNIKNFYQAKGSDQSIKFLFNCIVAKEPDDVPTIVYPKEKTVKASAGIWINKYALKVKVYSGDATKLIGQKIYQNYDDNYSFAYVDNVSFIGNKDGEDIYEIILAPETVVGNFEFVTKTYLTKQLSTNSAFINVYSTLGWKESYGEVLIGNETIKFIDKSINQFKILSRNSTNIYPVNTAVYSTTFVYCDYVENTVNYQVKMIPFGILYDVKVKDSAPYSSEGDIVQISDSGFVSLDPKVYNTFSDSYRWKINESNLAPILTQQVPVQTSLSEVLADVSALFEDDQYYYVTSSGFPSYDIGPFSLTQPQDQRNLKLIKKYPTRTTEIYPTPDSQIGMLVNGIPLYGYKDTEKVINGGVESITVTNKGSGYKAAPYVLFDSPEGGVTAVGSAVLSGDVVESIKIVNAGSRYTSNPSITITSGRNGYVSAIVTNGRVTSLVIVNPGEYYSSPPIIQISDSTGKGRGAKYKAVISADGRIVDCVRENEEDVGKFYTQENISVEVIPAGSGATATSVVTNWTKNRFKKLQSSLDSNFGYYFNNNDIALGYGYAQVANPRKLRISLSDNLNSSGLIPTTKVHSKIIGFAYDGNPIYGPWGYSDPNSSSSSIVRMTSSYVLNTTRNGPSVTTYPLGTFIEDYTYSHRSGTLDENNGRFCVTPEYPNGTYAYFMTIGNGPNSTTEGDPAFPYILGKNFYCIPVEANYKGLISQKDLPKNVKRYRTGLTPNNGIESYATIGTVNSGKIESVSVESSPQTFNVNSLVYFDERDTEGSGATAAVSSVKGKTVSSLKSKAAKIVKVVTTNNCYLYDGSTITQTTTNASGIVVGDIFDNKTLVIKTTSGTFDSTHNLNSSIKVSTLVLNQSSSYAQGSTLILTNGTQLPIQQISNNSLQISTNPLSNGDLISFNNSYGSIVKDQLYYVRNVSGFSFQISSTLTGAIITLANTTTPGLTVISEKGRGVVLDEVIEKNTVKVKIIQGSFTPQTGYYIRSFTNQDTVGSGLVQENSLSQNIQIFSLTDKVVLVNTSTDHGISINDTVDIDIIPNDSTTTTTYYVRKRIYQNVTLTPPSYSGVITDTGIGVGRILNSGDAYANGNTQTFTNVELIFADQTKCRDAAGNIVGSSSSKVVLGKSGNTNNALATVIVLNGKVASVSITSKGVGYKPGDVLTVTSTSLNRLLSSTSTQFFIYEVLHAGLAAAETTIKLSSVDLLSVNDTLTIENEIVKIQSINKTNSTITVLRGQQNTTPVDHYDQTLMTLKDTVYTFAVNSSIGDATVVSYDSTTQSLLVAYDVSQNLSNITALNASSVILDQSNPTKSASIVTVDSPQYRFEFSKDQTIWQKNPIIDIQKYYTYKFDTSHFSMTGSFFELSPSANYNIFVTETKRSSSLPGSAGSYISIKLGFGDLISSNLLTTKYPVNYTYYYYFDKAGIASSEKSYLRVIDDPLQGEKTVNYVTPSYFLYDLDSYGQYDGTGTITYTTTSITAIGKINQIYVSSGGEGYKKTPLVIGALISPSFESTADVIWNNDKKSIESVNLISKGKNYVNPKAIIVDGDGYGAEFSATVNPDGSLNGIIVLNGGKNYSYKPSVKIIESNITGYASGSTIGSPKTVKISYNGSNYENDSTLFREFTSSVFLTLKNFTARDFIGGEEIKQYIGTTLIAKGYVSKNNGWRKGSNILKIERVTYGKFIENVSVYGNISYANGTVSKILTTVFLPDLRSYYDNLGYYSSDTSKIGEFSNRLSDSYYYQDYSYAIKSKTSIEDWRTLVDQTVHPAGFKVFGEMNINSEGSNSISSSTNTSTISFIQLWNPQTNNISTKSVTYSASESIISSVNTNKRVSSGSALVPFYSTDETLSFELVINDSFDGYFDESGNRAGTKTFNLYLKSSNIPFTPYSANNLIITLDGVLQEPGKSFTISQSQITFAEAPLGYRNSSGNSVSLANYKVGVDTPPQKFVCRYVSFKLNATNASYFQKIKDISENPSGRFLDAANLITNNKEFIIKESIGYLKNLYPTSIIKDDYYREIIDSYIDSVIHDIRYSGNSDIITLSNSLTNNQTISLPQKTLDVTKYARNLIIAATRNWDVVLENCQLTSGSSVVTVSNTYNIIIGMRVIGKGIPAATFVKEIINDTQLRLGNKARTSNVNATFTTTPTNTTLLYFSLNSLANDPTSSRDVGQFLDAAKQIEDNKEFIQQEAYGWALATYPYLLTAPVDITKCQRDIGYVLDAVIYDLRYGGNLKIIEAAEKYYVGNTLSFINNQKTESLATFNQALLLAKLAAQNWAPSPYVREFDTNGSFVDNLVSCIDNGSIQVAITSTGKIYSSPINNIVWTQRSYTGVTRQFNWISCLNNTFFILCKGAILKSTDGITWSTIVLTNDDNLQAIEYDSTLKYIAVGKEGNYYTSTDGNTWILNEIYFSDPHSIDYPIIDDYGVFFVNDLNDVVIQNGNVIVASTNGRFFKTTDLINWSIIETSQFYGDIVSITSINNVLTAITSLGYSLQSSDNGNTWSKYNITPENQTDYYLSGHVYAANEYLAFGSYSTINQTSIFGSLDGQTWYPLKQDDYAFPPNLTITFNKPSKYANNRFFVGNNGGYLYRARVPVYQKQYALVDLSINPNIRIDANATPYQLSCSDSRTAVDNLYGILQFIINNGLNKVTKSYPYPNPAGAFNDLTTYPDYTITQDYTYPECANVASAISTLYTIFSTGYTQITAPTYFDGKSTAFSLYYEDNTPVQLNSYENLIVGIDGVLQRAGITPLKPIDRSYYINRSVVPNQIVFVEPPKSFGEEGYQKFFAYNIGKYDIYTIKKNPSITSGPFNIISALTGVPSTIGDYRYALVFVSGILQKSTSYQITGSSIRFTEPLDSSADVYIMYWYGKDFEKSLILFGQEKPQAFFLPSIDSTTPLNAPYEIFLNDSIRIHGEQNLRKVLSDPYAYTKTEYRSEDENNISYSAFVKVENGNELSFGNGLDVRANIQGGKVISLTWNNKDYSLSSPQPNNYGYEDTPILNFVAQPQVDADGNFIANPQGGGAKGFAVCVDGQVIDVVLTHGGSGYVVAPLVYVAKKFDIIRTNARKFPTETIFEYQVNTSSVESLIVSQSVIDLSLNINQIQSFVSYPLISPQPHTSDQTNITVITAPQPSITTLTSCQISEIYNICNLVTQAITIVSSVYDSISIIETSSNSNPVATISTVTKEFVSVKESGVVDYYTSFSNNDYQLGQLGSTFGTYEVTKFMDLGFAQVSYMEQTIETFTFYHPTVTIGDFTTRKNSNIDSTGILFNSAIPTINDFGALLDISVNTTDQIIYISNTIRFPSSGYILLGDEIIYYANKLSDRFYNCTRGALGSVAKTHTAGDYLRTYTF